jgi:ABC-type bacteriocin/lantibiotic exporter with double-glycine peptidase domain
MLARRESFARWTARVKWSGEGELLGSSTPSDWSRLRQFLLLVRGYWRRIAIGLVLSLLCTPISLVGPLVSQQLIDSVYPAHDTSLLHALLFVLLSTFVGSAVLRAIQSQFSSLVQSQLGVALHLHFFNHLQHLPQAFFDGRSVGEIVSRLGDLQVVVNATARVVSIGTFGIAYLVLVPPLLFVVNWRLALVALATVPITTAVVYVTARILRRYSAQSAIASAELSSFSVETFGNMRTLKAMAIESELLERSAIRTRQATSLQLKLASTNSWSTMIIAIVDGAGQVAFTWFAWSAILAGKFSVGGLVAFSSLLGFVKGPAIQMASLSIEMQEILVRLSRVLEYLNVPTEVRARDFKPSEPVTSIASGSLLLCNIHFKRESNVELLRGIDIEFPQGSTTAIVGLSGSGKTSLLRIICGMEDPTFGRVLMDGVEVGRLDVRTVRRHLAVAWQDPLIVRGSFWDNLTLGATKPSIERVNAAVRVCELGELLSELPMRFETPLAEMGANLSGGQRQRIALARTLIRDAPVVVWDEATSQIDPLTEASILSQAVSSLGGRTLIFVTHRMATARRVGRICVLHQGVVAGVGTHDELHASSAIYRKLCSGAE